MMSSNPLRILTPADEKRLFAALVIQPFLAALVAFVAFPFVILDRTVRTLSYGAPTDLAEAALAVALGTALVAFLVTVFGVFPAAVWIMKRRRLSFGQTLVVGLGFASVPMVIGMALFGPAGGVAGALRTGAFAAIIGAVVVAVVALTSAVGA